MSGDLVARTDHAKLLATADLLPRAYQNKPANVLLAGEYAEALALPLMTVIQSVYVVDGKPTASAQLIGGLVRRAGHRLRVEGDDTHATATIVRCDDPEFTFTATWTLDRARTAGLLGKGTWKSYPAAMLKARAVTEVARDACPEALSGVAYTPEELGADDVAMRVERLTPDPADPEKVTREKRTQPPAEDPWATPEVVDVEVMPPPGRGGERAKALIEALFDVRSAKTEAAIRAAGNEHWSRVGSELQPSLYEAVEKAIEALTDQGDDIDPDVVDAELVDAVTAEGDPA